MKLSASARTYLLTLAGLIEEKGSVRQCDLTARLEVTRPSVFRGVSHLEELGLIVKREGLLFLSERGAAEVEAQRRIEKVLLAGFAHLGIDEEQARQCLRNPEGFYQDCLISSLCRHLPFSI